MTHVQALTPSTIKFGRKPEPEEFIKIRDMVQTHFGPQYLEGLHSNATIIKDDFKNESLPYKICAWITLQPLRENISDMVRVISVLIKKMFLEKAKTKEPIELKTLLVNYYSDAQEAEQAYLKAKVVQQLLEKEAQPNSNQKSKSEKFIKLADKNTMLQLVHFTIQRKSTEPGQDKVESK
jgi:hypothetical protein